MASIRTRKDNGCLFLDFYYRGTRCREQTALTSTSANRKRLEKVLGKIEEEIRLGSFDYARYFPSSRNAARFRDDLLDGINASPSQAFCRARRSGGNLEGDCLKGWNKPAIS